MQRGISALKYVLNNKKRVCLLIFSFGLFIAINYCYEILIGAGYSSFNDYVIRLGEIFQVVCLNSNAMRDISENESVDMINEIGTALSMMPQLAFKKAILCDIVCFEVNTVIGVVEMGTVFLTDTGHVEDFLEYTGAQLTSSEMRMPQYPGEILIGEAFARNIKANINDTLSVSKSNTFRIVGIVSNKTDGPCFLSVGINHNDNQMNGVVLFANGLEKINGKSQAINYKDEFMKNPSLNALMSRGMIEYVVDYTDREIMRDNYLDIVNRASAMIKTVSTITVFVTLLIIFNLYMKDRYSEWCLFNSVGYSSKYIYLLIVRELLIILGCSILIAFIWFLFIYAIMYYFVFEPLCLHQSIFIPDGLLECLSIVVMFFGILQASVFYAIQRIKTVDAIDDSFL